MRLPQTLYARTALILATALIAFLFISSVIYGYFVLRPAIKQSSDATAAFLVLTAQTWSELPPETRSDYEAELWYNHQISLYAVNSAMADARPLPRTLNPIKRALERRLGESVHVGQSSQLQGWLVAEFTLGEHVFNVSFDGGRVRPDIPAALLSLMIAAGILTLLGTLLIVRHLTRPLALLSEATVRFGEGKTPQKLAEHGPEEFKRLTRHFNEMTSRLNELMGNRTTLLAGISHDLRTPIARLSLALEVLPDDIEPDLQQRMRQDLVDMNRLITETLALARSQDEHLAELDELDLPELIDGVLTDYRSDLKELIWIPGDSCIITVDALALSRVLKNLIENAIRYGGGQLAVSYQCKEDLVTVTIADRGPGIAVEQQKKVFQPFYRIESSRNAATGGSGLGLAIVDQICTANGWKVALSDRPEGGLNVTLRLPKTA